MNHCVRLEILALLLVASTASAAQNVPQETARLHKLCELWGGIKYFHPKLGHEAIDWDGALISAITDVRKSKSPDEYRASVASFLSKVGDPLTKIKSATTTPGSEVPARKISDVVAIHGKVVVIDLAGAVGDFFSPNYNPMTERIRKAVAEAQGVVFDCRASGLDPNLRYRIGIVFSNYSGIPIKGNVTSGTRRFRSHFGFAPSEGASSGGYYSSVNTESPKLIFGEQASPKNFVVLVDEASPTGIYSQVAGLQAAGQCRLICEGPWPGDPTADLTELDMGEGLSVQFPTSELIAADGRVGVRPDALAKVGEGVSTAIAAANIRGQSKGNSVVQNTFVAPLSDSSYPEMTAPSLEYRLLGLFRYWNTIRYFFPYLHLIGRDWAEILNEMIPVFESAETRQKYVDALCLLNHEIHDSHGSVIGEDASPSLHLNVPSFRTRFLEDKFVISTLTEEIRALGVNQGDELLEVDGGPPQAIVDKQARYFAFSRRDSAQLQFSPLAGPKDSEGTFTIRRQDGRVVEIKAKRNNARPTILVKQPAILAPYGVLPSGFGYIDLTRVTSADIDPSMNAVQSTPGLIFDMRGYPNGTGWSYGSALTSKPIPVARFLKPVPSIWSSTQGGGNVLEFIQRIEASPAPKYKGKVVVLINGFAISQAEHTCLILKSARPDAVFIGLPTAGANGDMTNVVVPGGITMSFSGQAVTWVDGRPLQRAGIIPDVHVSPTVAGTFAGTDEILEAAITFLQKGG